MDGLVDGDDGLPAEEVGPQAKQKHEYLRRYLDISSGVRKNFYNRAGATYIDLFCSAGRARIRDTGEWIDGSAVAAWKISQKSNTPFSAIYVADADPARCGYTAERLRRLGAPVHELKGDALQAAAELQGMLNRYALHFAFLDPYNLASLDFGILESLAGFQRMDLIIHVSAMDLQRNLEANIRKDESDWDSFAPGWRDHIKDMSAPMREQRRAVMDYWRGKVAGLGLTPGKDEDVQMKMVTGSKGQYLYWLLLAAKHDLAHKFWKTASNPEGQGDLFS